MDNHYDFEKAGTYVTKSSQDKMTYACIAEFINTFAQERSKSDVLQLSKFSTVCEYISNNT